LLVLLSPQLKVLKGNSDFLAQFTAGQLLLQGQGSHLYDLEAQKHTQSKVLASLNSDVRFDGGLLLFSHPPFVALSYVPFASLPFATAYMAWSVFSGICFAAGIAKLISHYRLHEQPDFELLILGCVIYLPIAVTFWQGQNTGVAFLFLVMAFRNFKQASEFRAGVWLSLALVKFQILPVAVLVLLLKRRWRALLAFVAGSLVLLLISLGVVGLKGFWSYLKLLSEMPGWVGRYGVDPLRAHCIRGQMFLFFHNTMPGIIPGMTILLSAVLVMVLVRCWTGKWKPESELFRPEICFACHRGFVGGAPHQFS
jgi:Glycosyltransferase family 87